jgi:hypothetical protein
MENPDVQGTVKTSSRMHAWWLTKFRGYSLEHLEESPNSISFGQVVYKRTWWLKPQDDEK